MKKKLILFIILATLVSNMVLAVPAFANGPENGVQVWKLDSEANYAGCRMEKASSANDNGQSGQIVFAPGQTVIWIADQPANADVTFSSGNWMAELVSDSIWGDNGIHCTTIIGYWQDGFHSLAIYLKLSDYETSSTADKLVIRLYQQADSLTIPEGTYLALLIRNDGDDFHNIYTGEGEESSFFSSPQSNPGYPLPELASWILLGISLTGLTAFAIIRKKKSSTTIS